MGEPEHVILVAPAGDPVTGLWCDSCLLPSLIEAQVSLTSEDGSSLVTHRWCVECGSG